MRAIFLDTGPLGLVVHPRATDDAPCKRWLSARLFAGHRVVVPEICDYELRRELLLNRSSKAIANLDAFSRRAPVARVTPDVWHQAAGLWARLRQEGQPTADRHALDGDVILCATALLYARETGLEVVIATTNVGHLERMATAALWEEIT